MEAEIERMREIKRQVDAAVAAMKAANELCAKLTGTDTTGSTSYKDVVRAVAEAVEALDTASYEVDDELAGLLY